MRTTSTAPAEQSRRRLSKKVSEASVDIDGIPKMCASLEEDNDDEAFEDKKQKKQKDKKHKGKQQKGSQKDNDEAMEMHRMLMTRSRKQKRPRQEERASSSGSMGATPMRKVCANVAGNEAKKKELLRKATTMAATSLPAVIANIEDETKT